MQEISRNIFLWFLYKLSVASFRSLTDVHVDVCVRSRGHCGSAISRRQLQCAMRNIGVDIGAIFEETRNNVL